MTDRKLSSSWLWLPLAVVLAAIVPYANTLGHGFAVDDFYLFQSPLLEHPLSLGALFSNGFYTPGERILGLYRPIGDGSLLWNAAVARGLFGDVKDPVPYHAVNILLHAGASLLVLLWLLRVGLPRFVAGACAVLWAVHPIHAEVVANVTARYESLAAVFGLGFLILQRGGRAVLAALCLLAALWSKESAIAFLPLAVAADLLFPRAAGGRSLRAWIGPACVLAGWLALRAATLAGESFVPPDVENPLVAAPALARVLTAAQVQVLYLRDQFCPFWLSTDWSYDQIPLVRSALAPAVLGFAAILAAAIAAGVRFRRTRPEWSLVVLGYACAMALASNFIVPIGTILADRLMYVPSIFTCLLAAILLGELRERSRAAAIAATGAAALLLGVLAVQANRIWKDELTLYREQVRTAPRSAKAHGNLGGVLLNLGQAREAIPELRESIRIYPRRPQPYLAMAQAIDALGADPELSIQAWSDALRHVPIDRTPALERALRLVDLGRWRELEELVRQTAAADPADRFAPSLQRILLAADRLSKTAPVADAIESAAEMLRRGDASGAALAVARAIHRGSVPPERLAEALALQIAAYERLGNEIQVRELREAAAEVAGPR